MRQILVFCPRAPRAELSKRPVVYRYCIDACQSASAVCQFLQNVWSAMQVAATIYLYAVYSLTTRVQGKTRNNTSQPTLQQHNILYYAVLQANTLNGDAQTIPSLQFRYSIYIKKIPLSVSMQLLTQCTLHISQQKSHTTNGSLTNNYSTFLVSINTFLACLHLACPDIICSSSAHLSTTGNQAFWLEAQLKRHCIRSSRPQGY